VKGKIKQKWGQLTDDDLAQINGRRDQLEGRLQQRYGLAKDLVRKEVDDWLEPRQVIPARQARQGVTGHNVRFVLGFSIAAVVIVFAIIWFIYFA
jgi:uncharacterized protein YjbJ (UPF0337 family)